jgi:hypothetical protein
MNGNQKAMTSKNLPFLWETEARYPLPNEGSKQTYEWKLRTVFRNYSYNKDGILLLQVFLNRDISKENSKKVRKVLYWAVVPLFMEQKEEHITRITLNEGPMKVPIRNLREHPLKAETLSLDIAKEKIESPVNLNIHIFTKKTEPKVEKAVPNKQPFVAKKKQWITPSQKPIDADLNFRRGYDGFYIYVDGLRFLPFNCTVTRVTMVLLDNSFSQIEPKIMEFQLLDSNVMEPQFTMSEEFIWRNAKPRVKGEPAEKGTNYNPTMIAFFKIETLDVHQGRLLTVGHSILPLFLDSPYDGRQVLDPDAEPFFLNEGAFQIPIRMLPLPDLMEMGKNKSFDQTALDVCPAIPMACMLVRVERMTERERENDNKAPLISRAGFDPVTEWRPHKLYNDAPNYQLGYYDNTKLATIKLLDEKLMYASKMQGIKEYSMLGTQSLKTFFSTRLLQSFTAKLTALPKLGPKERAVLLKEMNLTEDEIKPDTQKMADQLMKSKLRVIMGEKKIYEELSKLFVKKPGTQDIPIDYNYSVQAIPKLGFYISFDGVLNIPQAFAKKDNEPNIIKALYRLFPVQDQKPNANANAMYFTQTHDMSASIRSPEWRDEPTHFTDVPIRPNRPVILFIELRTVMNPINAMLVSDIAPDMSQIKGNKKPTSLGVLGWTAMEVYVSYNRKPPPQYKDEKEQPMKKKKEPEEEDPTIGKPMMEPFIRSGKFVLPVFQGQLSKRMLDGIITMNNGLDKGDGKVPVKTLLETIKEITSKNCDAKVLGKFGLTQPLQRHDGMGLMITIMDAQRKEEFDPKYIMNQGEREIARYRAPYLMDILQDEGIDLEDPDYRSINYYLNHKKKAEEFVPLNSFFLPKQAWQFLQNARNQTEEKEKGGIGGLFRKKESEDEASRKYEMFEQQEYEVGLCLQQTVNNYIAEITPKELLFNLKDSILGTEPNFGVPELFVHKY